MPPGTGEVSWSTRKARLVTLSGRLHALNAVRTDRGGVLRSGIDVQPVPRLERVVPVTPVEHDAALHAVQDLVVRVCVPVVRLAGPVAPRLGTEPFGFEPLTDAGPIRRVLRCDPDAHVPTRYFASPRPTRFSMPSRV